jgi:molybdenum cofactor synthesis domain-containing protein
MVKNAVKHEDKILTPRKIHLIAIGNELLNGETRETNLAWLIKWFTRRGGNVVRASIIKDDFGEVDREIKTALGLGSDLILTTGGLGPTDDDATMAAVANCLGLPLVINKEALGYVKERIESLKKFRPGIPARLTKERKSMAFCPVGGRPLKNPVGVAPGMVYEIGKSHLIVLPGVPSEMKGIVNITLKPFFKEFFEGVRYVRRNIKLQGIPEAELAPFIRRLNKKDPWVYVKSKLNIRGKLRATTEVVEPSKLRWQIILHFSLFDCTVKSGRDRIDALIEYLMKDLQKRYKYPFHVDL